MGPRSQSGKARNSALNGLRKVFQFRDVKDGTAGRVFGKAIRIQIQADFNGVFHDERHVVIGDVVMGAVREADAERLEWLGLKQPFRIG